MPQGSACIADYHHAADQGLLPPSSLHAGKVGHPMADLSFTRL
ncbi:hypothetical protein IL54_1424 [Sphingobium sp. ba1]|nr:hypothetical protein IL54_1424 [Sphingobium sp. ba1]